MGDAPQTKYLQAFMWRVRGDFGSEGGIRLIIRLPVVRACAALAAFLAANEDRRYFPDAIGT